MVKLSLKFNTYNFSVIFIIINIFAFSRMFFYDLRIGAFTSIFALLLILAKPRLFFKEIDALFFIFIVIQVLSFANYFFNDLSREIISNNKFFFLKAINYILIPQIFFYVIGKVVADSESAKEKNIRYIIFINTITIVIGIFLLQIKPNFYREYVQEIAQQVFYNNTGRFYPRLISYLDTSMIIGIVCAFTTVLAYYFINNKRIKIAIIVILLLGSLLTMARGSWVALAVSFILIGLKTTKNPIVFTLKILMSGVLIIIIFKLADYFNFFVESEMENKLNSVLSAFGERIGQWKGIVMASLKNPFGFGLGLTSHKGVNVGFPLTVPDGNYFRILGDTGIIGFIFFLFFLVNSLIRSYNKDFRIFLVLLIFCLQAIGTNVFDLYYAGYFFWFFVGMANNKQSKE